MNGTPVIREKNLGKETDPLSLPVEIPAEGIDITEVVSLIHYVLDVLGEIWDILGILSEDFYKFVGRSEDYPDIEFDEVPKSAYGTGRYSSVMIALKAAFGDDCRKLSVFHLLKRLIGHRTPSVSVPITAPDISDGHDGQSIFSFRKIPIKDSLVEGVNKLIDSIRDSVKKNARREVVYLLLLLTEKIGNIYEDLIGDDFKKKTGQFYTSLPLVYLILERLGIIRRNRRDIYPGGGLNAAESSVKGPDAVKKRLDELVGKSYLDPAMGCGIFTSGIISEVLLVWEDLKEYYGFDRITRGFKFDGGAKDADASDPWGKMQAAIASIIEFLGSKIAGIEPYPIPYILSELNYLILTGPFIADLLRIRRISGGKAGSRGGPGSEWAGSLMMRVPNYFPFGAFEAVGPDEIGVVADLIKFPMGSGGSGKKAGIDDVSARFNDPIRPDNSADTVNSDDFVRAYLGVWERAGLGVYFPDLAGFIEYKARAFFNSVKSSKFDIICGNPPYVSNDMNPELFRLNKRRYLFCRLTYANKMDFFYWFILLGTVKLRPGGKLGFITTRYWLDKGLGTGAYILKKMIIELCRLKEVVLLRDINAFTNAQGQENVIFVITRKSSGISKTCPRPGDGDDDKIHIVELNGPESFDPSEYAGILAETYSHALIRGRPMRDIYFLTVSGLLSGEGLNAGTGVKMPYSVYYSAMDADGLDPGRAWHIFVPRGSLIRELMQKIEFSCRPSPAKLRQLYGVSGKKRDQRVLPAFKIEDLYYIRYGVTTISDEIFVIRPDFIADFDALSSNRGIENIYRFEDRDLIALPKKGGKYTGKDGLFLFLGNHHSDAPTDPSAPCTYYNDSAKNLPVIDLIRQYEEISGIKFRSLLVKTSDGAIWVKMTENDLNRLIPYYKTPAIRPYSIILSKKRGYLIAFEKGSDILLCPALYLYLAPYKKMLTEKLIGYNEWPKSSASSFKWAELRRGMQITAPYRYNALNSDFNSPVDTVSFSDNDNFEAVYRAHERFIARLAGLASMSASASGTGKVDSGPKRRRRRKRIPLFSYYKKAPKIFFNYIMGTDNQFGFTSSPMIASTDMYFIHPLYRADFIALNPYYITAYLNSVIVSFIFKYKPIRIKRQKSNVERDLPLFIPQTPAELYLSILIVRYSGKIAENGGSMSAAEFAKKVRTIPGRIKETIEAAVDRILCSDEPVALNELRLPDDGFGMDEKDGAGFVWRYFIEYSFYSMMLGDADGDNREDGGRMDFSEFCGLVSAGDAPSRHP